MASSTKLHTPSILWPVSLGPRYLVLAPILWHEPTRVQESHAIPCVYAYKWCFTSLASHGQRAGAIEKNVEWYYGLR